MDIRNCIVSGINYERNWNMKSYSVTISFSKMASFIPHGLLTTKGFKFYNGIHMLFCETSNPSFLGCTFHCDVFPQVMVICLFLIKHVSFGFNIYQRHF